MLAMFAPRHLRLALLAALATGCVFGYRGAVPFAGEATLAGIDTVIIDLPPTELQLTGVADAIDVTWQGRFVALGASRKDALAQAERLDPSWESWERIGRLYADLPADLESISQLEQIRIESAATLAHEIHGEGSLFVSGIDAFLSIDMVSGSVEVYGGLDEIRVELGTGSVVLRTAARVEVESGGGPVELELDDPRATRVDCEGSVDIALAITDDLAIDIAEAGEIVVDLDEVAHLGKGSFQRNLGDASRPLRVRAGGGRVELRMLGADADTTDSTDSTTGAP
ncbi:hypothetical protein ACNOYE_38680 [Nannocystaceae bacterium ST9]